MNLTAISRYISLILRHKPEVIGITLNEHGWADVNALIRGIRGTREPAFSKELLDEIVRTDSKQRYAYNEDNTLIRASQGHSIPVDVDLTQAMPPAILWHGTGEKYTAFTPSFCIWGIQSSTCLISCLCTPSFSKGTPQNPMG